MLKIHPLTLSKSHLIGYFQSTPVEAPGSILLSKINGTKEANLQGGRHWRTAIVLVDSRPLQCREAELSILKWRCLSMVGATRSIVRILVQAPENGNRSQPWIRKRNSARCQYYMPRKVSIILQRPVNPIRIISELQKVLGPTTPLRNRTESVPKHRLLSTLR